MSNPTPLLLQVRGLRKDSGGRRVVDDVSFDVSAVAPVGESGSGKRTIAKRLSRLVAPDGGKCVVEGTDLLAQEPRGPSRSSRAQGCPESTGQCKDQLPKLETLSEGRRVRCFNRSTVHV